jgi:hypothetical protein
MISASIWLAWDIYRRYRANALSVVVAIALLVTLLSPVHMMFNGLETDLVVLVIMLIAYADAKRRFLGPQQSPAHAALFGLLLGLLVLARLDEAFLVVGIAIWSLIRASSLPFAERVASLLRTYWPTILVFAVVIAPYFAWNLAEFGHLTPISGTLKATFPQVTFRPDVLTNFAPYVVSTVLAGAALISMCGRPAGEGIPQPNRDLFTGLWIGCLIQVGWAMFFTRWGTFHWHFAAHIPTAILILSFYVPQLIRNPSPALTVCSAAVFAAAAFAFNLLTYKNKGDFHQGAFAAAVWARDNTPPDTVFALGDAGVFGYFSERPTINLDGLINSYEYQLYVREGRVMDFLRARRVAYIADSYAPCSYSQRHVWVRSYLPPRPPLTVAWGLNVRQDQEAFRSTASVFRPLSDRRSVCFIVWPFDTVRLEVRDSSTPLRH